MPKTDTIEFWKTKPLNDMSPEEWESLCDGCGQCCLVKLEDEDTGNVFSTSVACQLLDIHSCRCQDYAHRDQRVSTCLVLAPDKPDIFELLPITCAYRCLAEGRDLPDWHPLIQQEQTIHELGISVKSFAISEEYIHPDQLSAHILDRIPKKTPAS